MCFSRWLIRFFASLGTAALVTDVGTSQERGYTSEPSAARDVRLGTIATEPASFTNSAGKVYEYELGTLFVPENRAVPGSRLIGVGFARFRSSEPKQGTPPILLLPGGPAFSFIDLVREDAQGRDMMARDLDQYLQVSDTLLVDQRGYTSRGDRLTAELSHPPRPTDRPLAASDFIEVMANFAKAAVEEARGKGIDLRGYSIKECAHDVADLCKALGYAQVQLNGTSFGSQWAFALMRLHPSLVARALLSGVEPLDSGFDMPAYQFAAVQRMWHGLEQDEGFITHLPPGGFAAAAQAVIEKLERGEFTIKNEAGDRTLAVYGPMDFPWDNPALILELYHGRTDEWRRQAEAGFRGGSGPRPLIPPLIDSSLGTTPARRYRLETDPAARYVSTTFAPLIATADAWPTEDAGDDFRTPVLCDVPVLFLQGDWDTSTPLENTLEIAPFFVNSRVLIGERGGHGIIRPLYRQHHAAWAEVMDFLITGNLDGVPARVRMMPSRQFRPPRL